MKPQFSQSIPGPFLRGGRGHSRGRTRTRNRGLWAVRLGTVSLGVLLLSGCGSLFETDYSAPQLSMPTAWSQATTSEKTARTEASLDHWWLAFNDPVLTQLIEQSLATNNDLAAAAITVRRARLEAGLSERELWPSVSVDGTADAQKSLKKPRTTERSYDLTGSVSYEVDLWGRLSREADATRWEAIATQQDYNSTALSLTATTATLYWQTLYYRQRLAIARASIDYTRETLALVQTQYESGAASPLEVYEAQESVQSQEADATQIEQSLVESENALAILFNGPPGARTLDGKTLPKGPVPDVTAGVPSDILARRPDIQAAELRLREDLATVDATRASYLPTFSLTGSLGSSSSALKDVLTNPLAAVGASLALPFLNWNEMSLNIKVSRADYEKAVIDYRQTVYEALEEVENALSARATYLRQGTALRAALQAATQAEDIYRERYNAGAVSLQDWLDAQETRRDLEASELENRFDQLQAQATLYKVLGGRTGAEETARSAAETATD